MMVVAVVGDRVSDQSGGGGTCHREAWIHGLHRTTGGVVGGHAADAGTDGKQQ